MPKYQRFEELPVWQEAARLYNCALDLIETPGPRLSRSFCDQLERAALSVSNNIAEGFERVTTSELLAFLGIARGSAGEVRSMMAVVKDRPQLKPVARKLQDIRALADSCGRQLAAWAGSIEKSPVQGKRHLTGDVRDARHAATVAREYRLNFLRNLKPEHPLYRSAEARAARGEQEEGAASQ